MLAAGLVTAGAGVVWLGFVTTSATDFDSIVPCLLLTGLGMSLVFTPLLVAVLRNVPLTESPKAGAFISLALNLGGSIASASLVTLLDQRESFHGSILTAHATLANAAVQQFVAQAGLLRLEQLVARQSASLAYADTFFALGAFAIVLAPLAFALAGRKRATA